jgi:hypothetical protein
VAKFFAHVVSLQRQANQVSEFLIRDEAMMLGCLGKLGIDEEVLFRTTIYFAHECPILSGAERMPSVCPGIATMLRSSKLIQI